MHLLTNKNEAVRRDSYPYKGIGRPQIGQVTDCTERKSRTLYLSNVVKNVAYLKEMYIKFRKLRN